MFHKTYGEGDQIYLAFHGWAGDHREFAAIAARLPDDALWISVDLPGYGNSEPPTAWNMEAIAEQMERELQELINSGPKITLVGFCSGAVLGIELARRRPDIFRRIIMIDPFAFLPWYFRIFTWGEFGRRAYASTFMSPVGRKITDRILSSVQTSDADFTAAFVHADHELIQNYLQLFARLDGKAVFSHVDIEVDIVLGEKTFGAVKKSVRQIQQQWPDAHIHELARTGHLPLVKGARQLRRIIFESGSQKTASTPTLL